MKSVILIIVIGMLNICSGYARSNYSPKPGGVIVFTFQMGHLPDCSGFGICHLKLLINPTIGAMGGGMLGHLQINNTDTGIDMDFSKADLLKYQPDKFIYLDGKSYVTFDETFQFSNDIKEALATKHDLIIRPGTYPLTFIDGIFTIKLPY